MQKMSYGEQLRHPNWQRKRLEALDAYEFKCASCSTADKTLHVHHKHYVKGRHVWEYEVSELEVLCESCHAEAHEAKAYIDAVLSSMPTDCWMLAGSVLVGWSKDWMGEYFAASSDTHASLCGEVAGLMANLPTEGVMAVADAFRQIGPDAFMDGVRAMVAKDLDA